MLGRMLVLILISGISFIFFHELGHYVAAEALGLKPNFVFAHVPDNMFMGFSVGVSHLQSSSAMEGFVILGATILPLILLFIFIAASKVFEIEDLMFVAKIYFILIAVNLVPIPGIDALDANKLILRMLG
ncbi:MAG TPA: hypothetical protein VI933_04615 [archaeon]|nr:hypothetical protein [archaeon]